MSDDRTLGIGSRTLTGVVAVAAVYVSQAAQSVLALFLFADLLGAAVAIPLVYGLFSGRLTGTGALVSSVVGLVVGAALPAPDGLYLTAFAGAFAASGACTLAFAGLSSRRYDFDRLTREVRRLDDPAPDGGRIVDGEGVDES